MLELVPKDFKHYYNEFPYVQETRRKSEYIKQINGRYKKANKTFKDKTIKSEMKNTLNAADTLKRLVKWLIITRRGSHVISYQRNAN